MRHPALQQQGSPVSLTDIFCNVSVSVCVWFGFRLLLLVPVEVSAGLFSVCCERTACFFTFQLSI